MQAVRSRAAEVGPAARVAIVTGAARGIGLGISSRLARDGYAVAMVDLSPDVEQGARDLTRLPGGVIGLVADVTSGAAVDELFATVERQLGPPWLLVNSAGVYVSGPTRDLCLDDWSRVIAADLTAVFLCSQAAVRAMGPRGGGRIVNVSSIAGAIVRPNQIAYCAAKAGVNHFTRCLSVEVATLGITVNAVAPGMTRTRMLDAVLSGGVTQASILAFIPRRRVAEPADHAALVAWLASDDAAHVTGQVISVDGGQSLFQPFVTPEVGSAYHP